MCLLDRITLDEMIEESFPYSVRYKVLDHKKGRILYLPKIIIINPMFNEDGVTWTHEMCHHFYDNVFGEDVIEAQVEEDGLLFYEHYYDVIDQYVKHRLSDYE